MTRDDWGIGDPSDPEAAAREQRRREREARRRERAEDRPPTPEAPGARASDETAERPQAVPPPEERLPSTPARESFANRAAAMRRRLGGSGVRRQAPEQDPPSSGRRRRGGVPVAVGALALLAVAAIVAVAAAAVIDRVGGEDEPPPELTLQVENVTIPEGLSRPQVAAIARDAGLRGNYAKASVKARGFDPAKYGATSARNLEGFLFPATYELERNANVRDLVAKQLQAFEDNIAGVDMAYARSKNLTVYDVLTIASMIEREVQIAKERKLVAAVIYNRLRDGMPLGIDATTRFAVGNYTEPLSNEELASPSPYNTRLVAGLPPGPIGSPGLAAIEAAAHPARVDYIFYVVRPGTCGEHNFSSNEADFARDRDAYQQALEAEGGSPDTC